MCGIAIVGCGYVVDFYLATLAFHPELKLIGVFDRDRNRSDLVAASYDVRSYESLEELLSDSLVELVVNLTSIDAHFEVSKKALLAKKHVYSEKPLARELGQAKLLKRLAEDLGLILTCAPCSVLGAAAQTIKNILDSGELGRAQIVYAELDDGPIHLMPYHDWKNRFGVAWPFEDEMEAGCVMEHAGYYLAWLIHFFGKAKSVQSFSRNIVSKSRATAGKGSAPDFSVACIEFENNAVARLTCGIVAPEDHSLTVVCEGGILRLKNCWEYGGAISIQRYARSDTKGEGAQEFSHEYCGAEELVPLEFIEPKFYANTHNMDFARGIAETASLMRNGRGSPIDAHHAVQVLEIVEMMNQNGGFFRSEQSSDEWSKSRL